MKKKILTFIGILIAVYIVFVAVDCARLRYAETGTKPLITVSLAEYEIGNKYTGLGYSIKYYRNNASFSDVNEIYGAEFRLFDKILIWAWVE